MHLNLWDQREIIHLMLDNAPIIVDVRSLIINLCANNRALIIHLVSSIFTIILVKTIICTLITAIALVKANIGYVCASSTCTPIVCALMNDLIVHLPSNVLPLAANGIALIRSAILIKTIIYPLITAIALMAAYADHREYATAGVSQMLIIDLWRCAP